jgi:hypothetical protein
MTLKEILLAIFGVINGWYTGGGHGPKDPIEPE